MPVLYTEEEEIMQVLDERTTEQIHQDFYNTARKDLSVQEMQSRYSREQYIGFERAFQGEDALEEVKWRALNEVNVIRKVLGKDEALMWPKGPQPEMSTESPVAVLTGFSTYSTNDGWWLETKGNELAIEIAEALNDADVWDENWQCVRTPEEAKRLLDIKGEGEHEKFGVFLPEMTCEFLSRYMDLCFPELERFECGEGEE
jgi:hypothetical protein